MTYENNYLAHHGIKGMRWGIRRFQNEDGSYTKAGLERYRYDEGRYNEAKAKKDSAKAAYKAGNITKGEYQSAKVGEKMAKKQLSKAYDQVKKDRKADEGRRLYEQGRRITTSNIAENWKQFGVAAAANIAANRMRQMGKGKQAAALCVAGNAFLVGSFVRNHVLNRKLSAYYSHSRPSELRAPKKDNSSFVGKPETPKHARVDGYQKQDTPNERFNNDLQSLGKIIKRKN